MDIQKPAMVQHFLQRAKSFQSAAHDLLELRSVAQADYMPAIGLLSVHGCIALADALLVASGEQRSKESNHQDAAKRLRDTCSKMSVKSNGIDHFVWLLQKKTHFSYGEDRVDDRDLAKAQLKSEQFFVWAMGAFSDVFNLEQTTESTDA